MTLALFDLDNTLLAGDSDYLWGQHLIENGVVDRSEYEQKNQAYYDDYLNGRLDIHDFLSFTLAPLVGRDRGELNAWHQSFMDSKIRPIITDKARALVESHRQQGHTLVIITATNEFITGPIANEFNIDHLIATQIESNNNHFTGQGRGTPCFQEGKVKRLAQWREQHGHDLAGSWFYSDSHNDLPLLRMVDHPVVVDGDDKLRAVAQEQSWPQISLR